jgi:threonine synthase
MKYVSTRGASPAATLSEAIEQGLAPDGGLYMPERFPRLDPADFPTDPALPAVAEHMLAPFFEGDALAAFVPKICREAFTFPVPLRPLREGTSLLELFHGPTAAFKDVGARFLAAALGRIGRAGPLTILVATSGDTGSAVASAFHRLPGFEVVILYPEGMVSPRQEKLLTVWGDNVTAFCVRGDFDDCQRMVKEVLAQTPGGRRFSSANSINLGRLLPQMTYYASASLEYFRRHGRAPGFVVPTGNVGNALAAFLAQRCGLPVREIVLATNANEPIHDFLAGSDFTPRPTRSTLASAMDVGNPSNFERLRGLLGEAEIRRTVRAVRVTDDAIRDVIRRGPEDWGEVWEPHTATAVRAREQLGEDDWIIVSTAHPAKFETVVEPLIGRSIPVPPAMEQLLRLEPDIRFLEPETEALRRILSQGYSSQKA